MSRPLRIAMFVGVFPAVSETFILRQITGLIDLGHEVDIFADTRAHVGMPVHPETQKYQLLERTTYMDMPPESAPWEMPIWPIAGRTWLPGSEIPVHNTARVVRALPKFVCCFAKAPGTTLHVLNRKEYPCQAASLSGLYRLSKLVSHPKRYDVVHAHFGPVGNSFRFVRNLWRAPLVVSFHGFDVSKVPRAQGPNVYQTLFATADCVTANSNYMGEKLKTLGCPDGKLRKLSYGLNLDQYPFQSRSRPEGPVRIITIGRLVEKKGIEYVLRALREVARKVPLFQHDIIGDGPLRAKLEKLTAEQGLEKAVKFHGALAGDAIQRLLQSAHIFVLASVPAQDGDEEGTPVSLLEAQAVGLPVISTRHSGIPEIVTDGKSGFLVPERDVAALAERLLQLIEHPELWPVMGRQGRTNVENHFTTTKCSHELLRIYDEVLNRMS